MFKESEIQAVIATHLANFRVMNAPDDFVAKMLAQYVKGLLDIAQRADGFTDYLDERCTLPRSECEAYTKRIKQDGGAANVPERIRKLWERYLSGRTDSGDEETPNDSDRN